MALTKRTPMYPAKFRTEHPMARSFSLPQTHREPVEAVPSKYRAPKPRKRAYRGSDNPMAKRTPLTARPMALSDRTGLRGGAMSRRRVARAWVPA